MKIRLLGDRKLTLQIVQIQTHATFKNLKGQLQGIEPRELAISASFKATFIALVYASRTHTAAGSILRQHADLSHTIAAKDSLSSHNTQSQCHNTQD